MGWPHHGVLYSVGAFIPGIVGPLVMGYSLLERRERLRGSGARRGAREEPEQCPTR